MGANERHLDASNRYESNNGESNHDPHCLARALGANEPESHR